MKPISSKRPDNHNSSSDSNIQKEMSELLQIRNTLNSKLSVLAKTMCQDVLKFNIKNHPREIKNINSINLETNLFGTNRTFYQFSIDFKELITKIQIDVKNVLQVMDKFSFTRHIAGFINNGIMESFLKISDLMIRRQEFCAKLMEKIHENLLNGASIFAKNNGSNNLCMKCSSNLQRDKVISAKQAILLGGQKISNFYHRQLKIASQQDEDQNEQQYFYSKVTKARTKVKTIDGTDPHEIKSQEDIRINLEKLQSNLQKRKYDILSCLVEMGQFGLSLIKSSDKIEKVLNESNIPKQFEDIASLLPSIRNIPPKFNFKEFTFDIGKHFQKEIKDIEKELQGVKTKYQRILLNNYQQSLSKQIQCDIAKDEYNQQIERYKDKTQKQINFLNESLIEMETLNKYYKSKINEHENALNSKIFSKMDEDNNTEADKISIQKRMQKLVNRYERRIQEQQNELEMLRQLKQQNYKQSSEISNQQQSFEFLTKFMNNKENFALNVDSTQIKKKLSLFLQPMMKRMPQNHESQNKISMNSLIPFDNNQNYQVAERRSKDLEINSNVVEILINHSRFSPIEFLLKKSNIRRFQRKQSQVLRTRQIQILGDKENNKILSYIDERSVIPQANQYWGSKLAKINSYQSTKNDKIEYVYDGNKFVQQGKTLQYQKDGTKRYVSQMSSNIIEKKVGFSLTKNPKEKQNKKASKTLSLTANKKGQQDQIKSALQLPSLSSLQKTKLEKLKNLQKTTQINSKNNLLMKKKKKKRYFSQQNLGMQLGVNNQGMTMSLGSNLQKNSKQKKQYIIDFIPKIGDSNVSKFKQNQQEIIQNQIQSLFDLTSLQVKKPTKKGKYYTKIVPINVRDEYLGKGLKKEEIQLSTRIYSLLATIKLTDQKVYNSIREKMEKLFDQRQTIKNNCDQISMTVDQGNKSTGHLPLSLTSNQPKMQQRDSNKSGIQNEEINSKPDQSYLSKIINYLIVKHRYLCENTITEEVKSSNLKTCEHLMHFYQSLLKLADKIPSHPSTVQRR